MAHLLTCSLCLRLDTSTAMAEEFFLPLLSLHPQTTIVFLQQANWEPHSSKSHHPVLHALSCIFQQTGSPAICIGCHRHVTQACCVLGWSTVQKQALLPDSPAWCWCCVFITLLSFNSRLSPRSPWPQPCIQKPSLLPACLPRGSNLAPTLQIQAKWSQHGCLHAL